jgi:uncharacterized membrane protein
VSRFLTRAAGPTFVIAGALHFLKPRFYLAIMPDRLPGWLPTHPQLVYASGLAEAAGGLGLMAPWPAVRRRAGWWLVATLVAVFPANVHMALHAERYAKIPRAALWARLPFQGVFIAWVLRAGARGAA